MLAATGKPQLGGPAVDLPRVGEDGIDPSYRLERQGAGGALPGRARSASSKKCRLAWDQLASGQALERGKDVARNLSL